MNKGVLIGIGVLIAILAVGLISTRGDDAVPKEQVSPTTGTATPESTNSGQGNEETVAETREFSIDASEYKFSLATIKVKKGDRVKITLKNIGAMKHDFVLDEFSARTKMISGGQEETIEFVADKIGSYKFYCSVLGHRALGMEGTIVVE